MPSKKGNGLCPILSQEDIELLAEGGKIKRDRENALKDEKFFENIRKQLGEYRKGMEYVNFRCTFPDHSKKEGDIFIEIQ